MSVSRRSVVLGAAAAVLALHLSPVLAQGSSGDAGGGASGAPNLPEAVQVPDWLPGVNLAGGEFGKGAKLSHDYRYPTEAEIDYFTDQGLRLFRIPFRVARLLEDEVEESAIRDADVKALSTLISHASSRDAYVVLDWHDYGRLPWDKAVIGETAGSEETFAKAWGILAELFGTHPNVIFGLMNEPHDQDNIAWAKAANAAIEAIRKAGAGQLILVPGGNWSGAHSWQKNQNAEAMLTIRDPIDNVAFEAHQYLNKNNSGMPNDQVVAGKGETALVPFTNWLKEHNKRGFIGEFGFTAASDYMSEGEALLAHMKENSDVYIGFAYWAAGPWWGDYPFSVEPTGLKEGAPVDKPQLAVIRRYL